MKPHRSEKNKWLGSTNQIDIGMELGSGVVTSVLGRGGFATVYEIWNAKLEVKRAVKVVNPDIPEQLLGRFETEIKITANLHHPNIIEIHNVGEWNGLPYIEMEIIDGNSLKDIITKKGSLPVEVATAIFIFVCRALDYAHEQDITLYGKQRKGIVHCDIKPANIMITNQGVVKLTDFGLATPLDASLHSDNEKFNGTFRYASPEQLKMIPVDERTDIYSLAVAMYELYSGKRAFQGLELKELLKNRTENIYIPFDIQCPDIHPAIKKIIRKNMSYEWTERSESVHELLSDVEKVYAKLSLDSPEKVIHDFFSDSELPFSVKKPFNRRPVFFIAALGTLAVITAMIYFIVQGSGTRSGPIFSSTTTSQSGNTAPRTTQLQDSAENSRSVNKTGIPESTSKKTEPEKSKKPSTTAILIKLNAAVKKKEWTRAAALFKTHQLNDGEYYFLYARYLAALGKDAAALAYVEKGLKTPAQRIPSHLRRTHYLSTKAICLTFAFDRSKVKKQGEKAMEAWFDVKYLLKDRPKDIRYKYADAEIRRIHSLLRDATTN